MAHIFADDLMRDLAEGGHSLARRRKIGSKLLQILTVIQDSVR